MWIFDSELNKWTSSDDKLKLDRHLVEKEIFRIKEFSALARNSYESSKLIKEISDAFELGKLEN